LTPTTTVHFSPEFSREHILHLTVCLCVEKRYKLLGILASIHVEGEQTAVLASDVTTQTLQLSLVTVPGNAVTFYEKQDVGHERQDAVRIKVVGIRRFGTELYG